MTNEEYAEQMWQEYGAQPFRPTVEYYREGDCLEFVAKSDDYYAVRIDGLITVYHSRESGEIIGALIKNVSRLQHQLAVHLPGLAIEIDAGKVKLGHLFLAKSWTSKDPIMVKKYQRLAEVADQSNAEATLIEA